MSMWMRFGDIDLRPRGSLVVCQIVNAFAASEVWRQYRIAGGRRERILPDFLIGAHAVHEASQLISRDAGFYRQYFSGLAVEDPAGQPAT